MATLSKIGSKVCKHLYLPNEQMKGWEPGLPSHYGMAGYGDHIHTFLLQSIGNIFQTAGAACSVEKTHKKRNTVWMCNMHRENQTDIKGIN